METRQCGNMVCIHFFIRPFQIEGVIRKVKRVKKEKTYFNNTVENMLEQKAAWREIEKNRYIAQEMLQVGKIF